MSIQKQWICLMVNGTFHHGDRKAALDQITAALEKDLIEKKVVCNEHMTTSTGEYYVFIRCHNYYSHIENLKRISAIVSVIPSFENPHFFTTKEIQSFAGSVVDSDKPGKLIKGDMVLVKEGYLKNLYGVVGGDFVGKKYKVLFSFHLRKFSENITVANLQLIGNIFDTNLKPISGQNSEVPKIVKRHQLHRKPSRKYKRGRKRGK